MKRAFLIVSFLLTTGFVMAAPSPVKSTKKAYYTSPIREFRGATFYQWKNHDSAKVASTQTTEVSKKAVVEKVEAKSSASASTSKGSN